jgi:FRG domain
MQKFDHILKLFEAKGWYLYEGKPGQPFDVIVSCGRASTIEYRTFYHILPAATRHDDAREVKTHLANAMERGTPKYDDKVNQGNVRGVYIDDINIAFVSDTDSFVFPLAEVSNVEDAIKFNISNYNIHYFSSINEIKSFLKARNISPQRASPLPAQTRWTFVARDEDPTQAAIVPENPSEILFRGQVTRYEPCFPTAARGVNAKAIALNELTNRDQARFVLNYVRTQWFVDLLTQTAALKWMNQQKLSIDEVAVAQHYGLPTGYVDLTQSFDVATFFACCRYDINSHRWEPAVSGEGVIYAVDWTRTPFRDAISPIYLQVFPRPSEQWGWTHELHLGQDFDKLPHVTKLIFKHDAELSSKILQHFG